MYTKSILLALVLLCQTAFSQEITGNWFGTLEVQGQKLPLVFKIIKQNDAYTSTFDSPMQGAKDIAIDKTTFTNNQLILDATKVGFKFTGNLNADKITGQFSQNGIDLPLILSENNDAPQANRPQTPMGPYAYKVEEVNFKNLTEGNLLAGTLTHPKSEDLNKPALVMITGSGAQNRDEELFGHKPFLVISDHLANKGIATLRLDDRGIGGSDKGKTGSTTADFAGDISSAVNFLVKKGYKNIGLIGHSEGGIIAPMVAAENNNVKFLVLLAGPGVPIEELLLKQTDDLGRAAGATEAVLKTNAELNKKMYRFVNNYKDGNLRSDLKAELTEDLRKLPKDQMPEDQIEKTAESQANQLSNEWFRYFLKFNPDQYLSKVKIPVLALNGSLDLQVSAKENLTGIKNSLTKAANKRFKTTELPGLNHLFQTAKTGATSEYATISETFSPVALNVISDWINQFIVRQ